MRISRGRSGAWDEILEAQNTHQLRKVEKSFWDFEDSGRRVTGSLLNLHLTDSPIYSSTEEPSGVRAFHELAAGPKGVSGRCSGYPFDHVRVLALDCRMEFARDPRGLRTLLPHVILFAVRLIPHSALARVAFVVGRFHLCRADRTPDQIISGWWRQAWLLHARLRSGLPELPPLPLWCWFCPLSNILESLDPPVEFGVGRKAALEKQSLHAECWCRGAVLNGTLQEGFELRMGFHGHRDERGGFHLRLGCTFGDLPELAKQRFKFIP